MAVVVKDEAVQAACGALDGMVTQAAMRKALEAALPHLTDGSEISCVSASTQTTWQQPAPRNAAAKTMGFGFGRPIH